MPTFFTEAETFHHITMMKKFKYASLKCLRPGEGQWRNTFTKSAVLENLDRDRGLRAVHNNPLRQISPNTQQPLLHPSHGLYGRQWGLRHNTVLTSIVRK